MYILTARIFAMVTCVAAGAQIPLVVIEWPKKSEKPIKTVQKQLFLGVGCPIVTLWQQWGAKFPFTSKLTQRHACFRGR
jgi:hypothetical protein